MRADFYEDDPKTIWQSQGTEISKMSSVLLRQKARELQARRRRQVFGTVVVPVVVAFFYAFCVEEFPHLQPILHSLFVFALIWSVTGLYFTNRGKLWREMPEDAGFSTGLAFCRRAIEQQLNYFRRSLLWSLGPILLAIGTFIVAVAVRTSLFPKGMPFIALLVVWIASYLSIWVRQHRNLQHELDELREIDRENG
jgi:fatty-acid desaturase